MIAWRTVSSAIVRDDGVVEISVRWEAFVRDLFCSGLDGVQILASRLKL